MAAGDLRSFERLNYTLRPSKQVERKLFIEALHRLASLPLDYRISEYTYLGLGSVYYADFILFHKYLYIDDMICAEAQDIPRRMRFNKPFDFVNLRMNKVAEVIPTLDRERRHFVWLDYDCPLDSSVLEDIIGLFHVLALGSIVVVTVDAEPRLADDDEAESMTKDQLVARRIVEITDELGKYYEGVVGRRIFTPNALPAFYAQVLRNHFAEQISKRDSRDNAGFLQLFNFRYADGAQMLSLGGLIDDRNRLRGVRESRLFELGFIHENVDPIPISVPHLTVREKQYLDKCSSRKGMPFELQKEMFDNFRKYRRHYPTYYETLI